MNDKNGFSFASMFEESLNNCNNIEGTVVTGTVVGINNDKAIIDVGLKSEGRLFLDDIKHLNQTDTVSIGDKIEVYIEKSEDRNGAPILSIEKAKKEMDWNNLVKKMESNEMVEGVITGRTKGGFSVDINGTNAFLPGSQVDLRAVKDITPLLGIPHKFKILNMDKQRNNIVVSRRAAIEAIRETKRKEILKTLKVGDVIEGTVKNITDYGAFVDIGGIDGLLHITDISWKRINNPQDVISVGDVVKVQVIKFGAESGRLSLGMRQLIESPFEKIAAKYEFGKPYKGKVVGMSDYGAFVEIEGDVEGMVHISEMSWVRRNANPSKVVNIGDEVDVCIIEISEEKNRIGLSIKKCQPNPWQQFADENPAGTRLKGVVKNSTEFGVFVGITDQLDGMVHISDISWDRRIIDNLDERFKSGDEIDVVVLDVSPEKERISLGIKQLTEDPFEKALSEINKGDIVDCTVKEVQFSGLVMELFNGLTGFIRKAELSMDKLSQRTDKFHVGDKLQAMITFIDERTHKVALSIRAMEIMNEKEAIKKFSGDQSDGVSSLGDVLPDEIKN